MGGLLLTRQHLDESRIVAFANDKRQSDRDSITEICLRMGRKYSWGEKEKIVKYSPIPTMI